MLSFVQGFFMGSTPRKAEIPQDSKPSEDSKPLAMSSNRKTSSVESLLTPSLKHVVSVGASDEISADDGNHVNSSEHFY